MEVKLRELELKDAPLMLEWMHDPQVVQNLRCNFFDKSLQDCYDFIRNSWEHKGENYHFAVTDESDVYQGTVSLKNVDTTNRTAEFAIVICKHSMGKDIAKVAMRHVLQFGCEVMKLAAIFWCVDQTNERAIRFYDKNGYKRTDQVPKAFLKQYSDYQHLLWYAWSADETSSDWL